MQIKTQTKTETSSLAGYVSIYNWATTCDFQQGGILKRWACVATFLAQKLQMMFGQQLNTHRLIKRLAKALVSLCMLVLAFAGRTYHIVGHIMSRLVCFAHTQKVPGFHELAYVFYTSRDMRFPTMWYVRPAKPQIIRACWSEPLLVACIFDEC